MSERMPSLPRLPKMKSVRRCACGCTRLTGGTWAPGHDAKMVSRVKHVNAGVLDRERPSDKLAQLDAMLRFDDGDGSPHTEAMVEQVAKAIGLKWSDADRVKREAKREAEALKAIEAAKAS